MILWIKAGVREVINKIQGYLRQDLQNKTFCKLCDISWSEPQRRPVCASAESDQSSLSAWKSPNTLDPSLSTKRFAKSLTRQCEWCSSCMLPGLGSAEYLINLPVLCRLRGSIWDRSGIRLDTKLEVYRSVVLPTLLYACETWTGYQRHAKRLNHFHTSCLRKLLKIKWQDRIPDTEVLMKGQGCRVYILFWNWHS